MNLFFFGSSGRQLFGAHHAPPATAHARGAVLLCPPWGLEYLVSHRIFRRLAVRLSEAGYHVLRFDYYGTGDSAGERDEGDLTAWEADANVAADELSDISGIATIATIGVRLGGAVAWRLATTRVDVHTTLLWDPIVHGTSYLREMEAAQSEIDRWLVVPVARRHPGDSTQDLLGFPMPPAMRATIEAISPATFQTPTRAHVKVFNSDESPGSADLYSALRAAGTPFHAETIRGQTPWREDEAIGASGLPVLVLERMVAVLR